MVLRCCLPHLERLSCLLSHFLENANLDNSSVSLPAFPPRTNLKLHNIPVTAKMVLCPSKVSSYSFIPVVVLKSFEPELLFMLADLFCMCQKESCFPDC